MSTNLAEKLGTEPSEAVKERQQRIYEEYKQRKAMRRMARLCCMWLAGAAFTLSFMAGYAGMETETAVVGGVSLLCAAFGVLL